MALRVGLTYTQMKLGRAHEHLDQLEAEIGRFIKSKPYTERRYDDPENGRHVFCVTQKIMPDPIGVLVGEFAYSVRSSLDNLAWQLALLCTDTPSKATAFPVESECPGHANESFNKKIRCISPEALKVIESLQPYTRWPAFKSHPLWQVNKLCNLDKHQVVAVSSIVFGLGVFPVDDGPVDFPAFEPAYPDRHTACIAVPITKKDKVKFQAEVTGVIFGTPISKVGESSDFELGVDELRAIYKFVRYEAVPKFEAFFPK